MCGAGCSEARPAHTGRGPHTDDLISHVTKDRNLLSKKASFRIAYLWDVRFFIMLADTPAWPKREVSMSQQKLNKK